MQQAAALKVSFVSLGCPKALVDSERIITRLRAEGYELARKHDSADLVIVNTCGFLDSAKAESLAAIGSALKENGKVIVTGCMGAEPESISAAYPQVLAITGPQQYESVMDAVHRAAPPQHDPHTDLIPPEGIKLTPRHYAYLKISEGCNNRCTFCIIPKLRGDLVALLIADYRMPNMSGIEFLEQAMDVLSAANAGNDAPAPARITPPQPAATASDPTTQAVLMNQLPAFFQAYARGDQATLSRFLASGAQVTGLGGAVTFNSISQMDVPVGGATRHITVTVIWHVAGTGGKSPPGAKSAPVSAAPAGLEMTYEMTVVQQSGSWYVKAIGASTQVSGPP